MKRGYFGIGIENTKDHLNVGGLMRSAHALGAAFVFTIGFRYKRQVTDTTAAWKHIPLFTYETFAHFYENMACDCLLVGVEIDERAQALPNFAHPERAVYLLGAEDRGLSDEASAACDRLVQIPSLYCLNVATTGALVMYDRNSKRAA